jgi:hypothetical protein
LFIFQLPATIGFLDFTGFPPSTEIDYFDFTTQSTRKVSFLPDGPKEKTGCLEGSCLDCFQNRLTAGK